MAWRSFLWWFFWSGMMGEEGKSTRLFYCYYFPHTARSAINEKEGSHPISNTKTADKGRSPCKIPPQLLSYETTVQHPLLPSSRISRQRERWTAEQSRLLSHSQQGTAKESPMPTGDINPFGFL